MDDKLSTDVLAPAGAVLEVLLPFLPTACQSTSVKPGLGCICVGLHLYAHSLLLMQALRQALAVLHGTNGPHLLL